MNLKMAAAAAALATLPVAVSAQPVPSYASQDEQIRGTIASIGGKYTIYVRDERGFVDTVSLHDGTVINPTGLTLEPGQSVTIDGRTDGHSFDANEIDTPYNVDAGPYDVGPDAGYVSAYPYYSYYPAYALSYPAFISLGFGFGGYGGYGGYYGGGGYYGYGRYGHGYAPGYGHGGYGGAGYGRRYAQGSTYGNGYRGGATYGRGAATYGGGGYRGAGSYSRGAGGGSFHGSSAGGGSHGGGGGGGAHH
ncbi:MAG: hypothetical protein IAI48_15200 [Candidatus Eremiobacteraeota bacterium]|nr:hypothetical protein [Candidatus Eremiobacteraeota bacterium]